nr:isoform 6 of activating molecule in becn1-regulated autophagy protein 1 [Quercus suber]
MGLSGPHDQTHLSSSPSNHFLHHHHHSGRNVFHLIALREISPRTKHVPKRRWREASKPGPKTEATRDARRGLLSWVEAETLRHLSAKYCPLVPPPRSTIAAAFSPDGRTLASTHGDHTVKIIDCQTGRCLKVLSGHRRTPWVPETPGDRSDCLNNKVRFHPLHPEIIASGSLDYEVRLWDASTSECIGSRDFYRPIASIAFHAKGDILAVASGHKLYIWQYNKRGEASHPNFILKTRRSLRAVHFHPHAAPFLLTAEVNDLDSSDSSMTHATSLGYLRYPPPAVFVANAHSSECVSLTAELSLVSLPFLFVPSFAIDGSTSMQVEPSPSMQFQVDANEVQQHYNSMVSPTEAFRTIPTGSHSGIEDAADNHLPSGLGNVVYDTTVDAMETDEIQPIGRSQQGSSTNLDTTGGVNTAIRGVPVHIPNRLDLSEIGHHQFLPERDPSSWELPFLQGWLMGQSQADVPSVLPLNGDGSSREPSAQYINSSILASHLSTHNMTMPGSISLSGISGRSSLQNRFSNSHLSVSDSVEGAAQVNAPSDWVDTQPIISRIQSEITTSLAAVATAELPCTVKLRVWPHDVENPFALLNAERCCLTIPHAVLCR